MLKNGQNGYKMEMGKNGRSGQNGEKIWRHFFSFKRKKGDLQKAPKNMWKFGCLAKSIREILGKIWFPIGLHSSFGHCQCACKESLDALLGPDPGDAGGVVAGVALRLGVGVAAGAGREVGAGQGGHAGAGATGPNTSVRLRLRNVGDLE